MSRNISAIEKAIILILVMGFALGGGFYFLLKPSYDRIGRVDTQIESKKADIDNANRLREHARIIDQLYDAAKERAEGVHVGFYEEMTTTEAVTMVQNFLAGANQGRGHISTTGIDVTDISERTLSVLQFTGGRNVRYQLRDFAFPRGAPDGEDAEEVVGAIWSLAQVIIDLLEHKIGEYPEEGDESEAAWELRNQFDELINFYGENHTALLSDITEALKTNTIARNSEQRNQFLAAMRMLLAAEKMGVGLINAKFALELTYAEYLAFLDYINNFHLLTYIENCRLWQNIGVAGEDIRLYAFDLDFYVVSPIELPESPQNPFSSADFDKLDALGNIIIE